MMAFGPGPDRLAGDGGPHVVDLPAAEWLITAAPQAVSIKAETAPPWITPVAGSPTRRSS
jgi:hypothetical protein